MSRHQAVGRLARETAGSCPQSPRDSERPFAGSLGRRVFEAKSLASLVRPLAMPIARARGHGVVVDRHTHLLVEGFPRSANSFTVAAIQMAQPAPIRIAHHLHAPAHVLEAARLGVPALVLVRHPDDAVLLLHLARPALTLPQILRAYARFYTMLARRRDSFVVATFDRVSTDLGTVVAELNQHFGTSFLAFRHTEENVQACFDAMDAYWRARVGNGEALERSVGRPSIWRDRRVEEMRPLLDGPSLRAPRARAVTAYEALAG